MTNCTSKFIRIGRHRPLVKVEQLTIQRLAELKDQKIDSRMNLKDLYVSDTFRHNIEPLILKGTY